MKCLPIVVAVVATVCLGFHFAGRPELTTFGIGLAQMRFSTAACFVSAAYIAIRTKERCVGTLRQQIMLGMAINSIMLVMIMSVIGQLWPHVGVTLGIRPNALTILSMVSIAIKGLLIVNGNNNRAVIVIAVCNLLALAAAFGSALLGATCMTNAATGMSFTTMALLAMLFASDIHGRRWGQTHKKGHT